MLANISKSHRLYLNIATSCYIHPYLTHEDTISLRVISRRVCSSHNRVFTHLPILHTVLHDRCDIIPDPMALTVLDEWASLEIPDTEPYNPETEETPEGYRLGKLDTAEVFRLLQRIGENAQSAIATAEATNEPMAQEELDRLQQHAQDIAIIPRSPFNTSAVVGDMEIGKSTMIDSLLDMEICRTNAEGSACTQVAIAYRYPMSNAAHDTTANCTVVFFTAAEVNSIAQIHLDALQAHYDTDYLHDDGSTRDEVDEETQAQESTAPWLQAISWFEAIVKLSRTKINTKQYTDKNAILEREGSKFTEQTNNLANQAITSMADRKKEERVDDLDCDTRPRTRRILSPSISAYQENAEPYTHGRYTAIMKEVVVEVSSPTLQHGAIVKDLPGRSIHGHKRINCQHFIGLGDAHLMRTYTTRLGRHADKTFIVAAPDRANDDNDLEIEVRTAIETSRSGARDVHLIFTRSDVSICVAYRRMKPGAGKPYLHSRHVKKWVVESNLHSL
jgi:hypothetical protein